MWSAVSKRHPSSIKSIFPYSVFPSSLTIPKFIISTSWHLTMPTYTTYISYISYTTYISQQQIRCSICWRADKVDFVRVNEAMQGVPKITLIIVWTNSETGLNERSNLSLSMSFTRVILGKGKATRTGLKVTFFKLVQRLYERTWACANVKYFQSIVMFA